MLAKVIGWRHPRRPMTPSFATIPQASAPLSPLTSGFRVKRGARRIMYSFTVRSVDTVLCPTLTCSKPGRLSTACVVAIESTQVLSQIQISRCEALDSWRTSWSHRSSCCTCTPPRHFSGVDRLAFQPEHGKGRWGPTGTIVRILPLLLHHGLSCSNRRSPVRGEACMP